MVAQKKFLVNIFRVEIVSFTPYNALMSANGEPKLKRVKLSLSFPTNNETSVQNVFCVVKSKRKYKKKPQADSELRKISFFVENPQSTIIFRSSGVTQSVIEITTFSNVPTTIRKANQQRKL